MAAAAEGSGGVTVTLISAGGVRFPVAMEAARQSKLIELEYTLQMRRSAYTVRGVGPGALAKVVDYCNEHADGRRSPSDLESFDARLIDGADLATLCGLTKAAYHLQIDALLDMVCNRIGAMIDGKSPKQIKAIFGITGEIALDDDDDKI